MVRVLNLYKLNHKIKDGRLHFYHRSNPKLTNEIKAHQSAINTIEWREGILATGGDDKEIKLW